MDATAADGATGRRADLAEVLRRLMEAVLILVLAGFWASAFVGLDASGYWIDELWTLFVASHSGGVGEVVQRTMTDAHPPAYYVIVHYWMRVFGDTEAAARGFSALCAVAASALFVAWPGKAFSRRARLFAAAAGASSPFWFKQSQNFRSYALAMLILTALLGCAAAAKRRSRTGEPVGWGACAAIAALGLLGAFVHYYLFLAVGLLYLALLVGVPDLRLRATVLVGGCVIAAAVLTYIRAAESHSLFTQTWFSNDPKALTTAFANAWGLVLDGWAKASLLALTIGTLCGLWVRRRMGSAADAAPVADWICGVSLFLTLGLAVAGLAVSLLFKPSFSARNLMIAGPCVWVLLAWLFDQTDKGAPRLGLLFAALATIMSPPELLLLKGRLVNRTEDWRGSAQYIARQTACRGQDIAVVLPALFLPDTPFSRGLAEHALFGRYYRGGGRLIARPQSELAASRDPRLVALLGARSAGVDPCPVLAWGVHDLDDRQAAALASALARRPEVNRPVTVRRFLSYRLLGDIFKARWRAGSPAAYVFEVAPYARSAGFR